MPAPTPSAPAAQSPRNLLAWLSLGCSALSLLCGPLALLIERLLQLGVGSWYTWYSIASTLLALVALGLALLAQDRDHRAMPVGVALGASGVLVLSSGIGWASSAMF